jgi:hypothetical protein
VVKKTYEPQRHREGRGKRRDFISSLESARAARRKSKLKTFIT